MGLHLLCVYVCVCMLQFEDIDQLTGHLESLLHFRDHFYQRDSEAQEKIDQKRKELLTLQDQHRLLRLHKNNQLSQLQTKLEKARSEALTWVWGIILELRPDQMLLQDSAAIFCMKFTCPCLYIGKEVEPHPGNSSKENPPAWTD